jgi:uncharacterized membrane protein
MKLTIQQYKLYYSKYSDLFYMLSLVLFSALVFAVCAKINIFRLNNFDLGKFDLGNMNQMAWYTLQGKVMYLTDYFGSNVPRWSMSHVDPILLLFVPIFAVFPHVLTLVFIQIILILSCSLILYKLAKLKLTSNLASFLIAMAFLFYPALGFLMAWTGYHGVSVIMPFFLLAFYTYEKMHKTQNFSKKNRFIFWIMIFLTLIGKEQISLYIVLYGLFILVLRNNLKYGVTLIVTGIVWFVITFLVIIPHFTHYRVESYEKFAQELRLGDDLHATVEQDNYFLSRYEEFGDSYFSVALGMLTQPDKVVEVFFGGDKLDNFNMTLAPVLYMPFGAPAYFILSAPDFAMNYLTTAPGLSTAEIYNHRTSMIIPILFISCIYFVFFMGNYLNRIFKLNALYVFIAGSALLLASNIYFSLEYQNPVYTWFHQSVLKRISQNTMVFANEEDDWKKEYKTAQVGDVVRIPQLDQKDRSCALKLVSQIPDKVSISGPDYMGAHLSLRETYALFPALYTKADIVIADIFSQKVFRVFDLDRALVYEYTGDLIKSPNYKLKSACGNLFVFERTQNSKKAQKLPIQEIYEFDEKHDFAIAQELALVDFNFPNQVERNKVDSARFVFVRRGDESLEGYYSFISFVNLKDDSKYQVANLPSFGLKALKDWQEDLYYEENVDIAIPAFVEAGTYRAFVGITNGIKTRSVYLGEVTVK